MNRLHARSFVLLVLLSAVMSCAASQPAPQAVPAEEADEQPQPEAQRAGAPAEQPQKDESNPRGTIDLGMGEDSVDGDIVINRPNDDSAVGRGVDDDEEQEDGEQPDDDEELEDGEQPDDDEEQEDGEQLGDDQ
jgi:hypothetical protein